MDLDLELARCFKVFRTMDWQLFDFTHLAFEHYHRKRTEKMCHARLQTIIHVFWDDPARDGRFWRSFLAHSNSRKFRRSWKSHILAISPSKIGQTRGPKRCAIHHQPFVAAKTHPNAIWNNFRRAFSHFPSNYDMARFLNQSTSQKENSVKAVSWYETIFCLLGIVDIAG